MSRAIVVATWFATALAGIWFLAATLAAAFAAEEQLASLAWTGWQTASVVTFLGLTLVATVATTRRLNQSSRPARQRSDKGIRVGAILVLSGTVLSMAFLPAIVLSLGGAVVVLWSLGSTPRVS
jgi:hypothetical protein